jgi:hypothetical protein
MGNGGCFEGWDLAIGIYQSVTVEQFYLLLFVCKAGAYAERKGFAHSVY